MCAYCVGWEDVSNRCRIRSDDCLGHRCRNGATCVDGRRSYTCRCPPGYRGNIARELRNHIH